MPDDKYTRNGLFSPNQGQLFLSTNTDFKKQLLTYLLDSDL